MPLREKGERKESCLASPYLTNLEEERSSVPDSGAPGCLHCAIPADDMPGNLDITHSRVSQAIMEKFSFFCSEQII